MSKTGLYYQHMILGEALFVITHPIKSTRAGARQFIVGLDINLASPPNGSTIEEFPHLKISEAVALMFVARSGIQLTDYSKADQALMQKGKTLRGVPTHRNI